MTTSTLILRIQNSDSLVMLCPEIGGAIARFTWKGHDILRPAPSAAINERLVRQMGVYPLMPYSNRIGNAKLLVGEDAFTLRANFPPGPHAIHGFGWQRAWEITEQTADSVQLKLSHQPDADWPFACEASETVRLTPNKLQMTLCVKNTDHRPMPAGLGFHPFFPLAAETHLQSTWQGMWEMGADSLPTVLAPVPAEADFSQLRPVGTWKVDNCFTGWGRLAVLDYPHHRMALSASEPCQQIVVFAPQDGRDFIALEPVSHVNNASALMARGVKHTGVRSLAPGESMEISMTIGLTGRAAQKVV